MLHFLMNMISQIIGVNTVKATILCCQFCKSMFMGNITQLDDFYG